MKNNGKNLGGVLSAMAKGEKPYDQAAIDAALTQLEDTAKKLPTLFPASLKGLKAEGDYSPSPKIWEDKAGFDAHIASFAKVVGEAKAMIKDLDSLKATVARYRQGMRRLPRDLPNQAQLIRVRSAERNSRGRAPEASALFFDIPSVRRAKSCFVTASATSTSVSKHQVFGLIPATDLDVLNFRAAYGWNKRHTGHR